MQVKLKLMYNQDNYSMVVDAVTELHKRGFTFDFNLFNGRLFCSQLKSFINNEQFDIIEVRSFESEHISDRETVLYAIEWVSNGIKGILLDNRADTSNELACKLKRFWK